MRLQKFMAHCGVASRRKCEEIILQGRVRVNGIVISELGTLVEEDDVVELDGNRIGLERNFVYILLNKPKGCVTTSDDQFSRKTVLDYIDINYRVYPVGRLDYNTTGALILTNDGELANELMHPSFEKEKVYRVKIEGQFDEKVRDSFLKGIEIEGRRTNPALVTEISQKKDYAEFIVTLKEGRNRQIRRTCEAANKVVIELDRLSFDGIEIGALKRGQWRKLTDKEIKLLKNIGGKNGKR